MGIFSFLSGNKTPQSPSKEILTGADAKFNNSVLGVQQLGNLLLQLPPDAGAQAGYQQAYVTVSGVNNAGRGVDVSFVATNATCTSLRSFKARTLSQLPFQICYVDDDDQLVHANKKNGLSDDYLKRVSAITSLLNCPNHYQSRSEWLYQLSMHLDMYGESFTLFWRNEMGNINSVPKYMYQLEPSLILTRLNSDHMPRYQLSTGIAADHGFKDGAILDYFQCMHLLEAPYRGMDGFNKSVQAAELVSLDQSLDIFANYFLENAAKISGVVTYEKLIPKERLEEIKNRLSTFFAKYGLGDAGAKSKPGQVALLDAGMKYQRLEMPSIMDADTRELKLMTGIRLCALYGVPPQLIGLSEGKFNNTATLLDEYYKSTLCPMLTNVEDKLTAQLCRSYPRLRIRFNVDPILKGAPLDQIRYLNGAASLMSVNEQRSYLGMPKSDDPAHDKIGVAPAGKPMMGEGEGKGEGEGEGRQDTGSEERAGQEINKPKLRVAK